VVHDLAFQSAPLKYSPLDWLRQEEAWSANRKRAAKLIAVSSTVRDQIARHYPRLENKVIVVRHGYTPNPLMRSNAPKSKRIVFIGRVEKKKSVTLLIAAFSAIASRFPDWKLDIIGSDGYGAQDIKAAATASPVADRIIFHGYVSENEKALLLSAAAVFCHPSSAEGSSFPLLEAWDAGAAALVADIPVMREIGKDAASYFEPGDAASLAECLSALISNSELCHELADRGRQELGRYSWPSTAQKIGKIIFQTNS